MVHKGERSEEGLEYNFATNTLGTFTLTELMLPALRRGRPSRVVTVSSGGMLTEPLCVDGGCRRQPSLCWRSNLRPGSALLVF
jgi:dehydrogenase/reductase SDR family protein 12